MIYLVAPDPSRELHLQGSSAARLHPADWNELDQLAHRQGLIERLTAAPGNLEAAKVPEVWVQSWKGFRRGRAAHNLMLLHEEAALLNALRQAGIPAFPVKGVSLARILHGDPVGRFTSDLDLCVRPGDLRPTAAVLEQLGYASKLPHTLLEHRAFLLHADEHTGEAIFTREQAGFPLLVELHWKPLPLPEREIWDSLCLYPETSDVPSFSPEMYFLYLCAHVSGHGWNSLRWLCDVADFLVKFHQRMDPALFLRLCRRTNLIRRTGITLSLVEAYFALSWEPAAALFRSSIREEAAAYLRRPLDQDSPVGQGAVHWERMRLQDSLAQRARYLWWLLHPTWTEYQEDLARRDGILRSDASAWLVRAMRLGTLSWEAFRMVRSRRHPRNIISESAQLKKEKVA